MLCRAACAVIAFAMVVNAQSVISTRSGVVHFFEGDVYLGDQPLQSHLGRYPTLPVGGELRTGDGRAEVLLTPGVFLRLDSQSAIRMVGNDLADTQVELLAGSVMVESGVPNPDTSVTLLYQDWGIHLLRQGVYRIDADPAQLWVRQGGAEVSTGEGEPVSVESGMTLPLAAALVPEQSMGEPGDELHDWEAGRSDSISADNAITAQIDEDPASRAPDADDFTNFPLLGVLGPGVGPVSGYGYGYSTVCTPGVCQPGFSSIYLPGYTYRPLILSLVGGMYPVYTYPTHYPGTAGGVVIPRPIVGVGITPLPRPPVIHYPVGGVSPVHVAPVHVAPPPRIGGHR